MPDLFEGDQIVLAGRYDKPGATQVVITGKYQGKPQTFEYPADLAAHSDKFSYGFVEQIWATRRIGYLLDEIQLHGQSKEIVDELVRLSKQYGIITPYTSFLADEGTKLDNTVALDGMAGRRAGQLADKISGGEGQMHAKNRALLSEAKVAAPAGAPARMYGAATVSHYERGEQEVVVNVKSFANRAFYLRGRQWIDSRVADRDARKLASEAKVIHQFSDEYFKLAAANSSAENQILATLRPGEELIVELRGTVYRITTD